ncbi:MAG TPA: RsmE family RNA methyltransferase [Verrucomicrobiae bacterium]|nr:RsmE family RNA methyltransferase [Verrucomicrobiae bacterium]
MNRFFLGNLQQPVLSGPEAHHALHVLRLKTGDTLNVFDGRGHEAQCAIAEIVGDSVRLKILTQSTSPALPCRITLAQAIPKKSMDLIVQKATELGVAVVVPLISDRTIVKIDEDSKRPDRWRDIALDACKQCGNNWLPEIQPPQAAHDFLASLPKHDLKLIGSLQPDAKPLKTILSGAPSLGHSSTPSVLLLIGPEGDFTPAELGLAKSAGCLPLSLGPLVLRAETAAIYALSILHHELQVR